jgi:hypothetical protein
MAAQYSARLLQQINRFTPEPEVQHTISRKCDCAAPFATKRPARC